MRTAQSSYCQKLFTDHTVWHGPLRGLTCWYKYQNSLAWGKLYKLHSILESTDGCTKVHIQNVSDVTCWHFDNLAHTIPLKFSEVLSNMFLLEWSGTCQHMLSQKQVWDWIHCLEVLHSKQVCLYHQNEMQHSCICVLIRQLVHKFYSTDHEARLNFFEVVPSQDVYWRNWSCSHCGNGKTLFHDTGHTNSQNTSTDVHKILNWSVKCHPMMLEFSYAVLWMPLGFFFWAHKSKQHGKCIQ